MQAAVDTRHHLIVAHEVTNKGFDRGQLSGMARQAREVMGHTELTAIADLRPGGADRPVVAAAMQGASLLNLERVGSGAEASGGFCGALPR